MSQRLFSAEVRVEASLCQAGLAHYRLHRREPIAVPSEDNADGPDRHIHPREPASVLGHDLSPSQSKRPQEANVPPNNFRPRQSLIPTAPPLDGKRKPSVSPVRWLCWALIERAMEYGN